jgi:hypothetical protein
MMTSEATPPAGAEATAGGVAWRSLYRNTHHRTSGPTNDQLRALAWMITQRRAGAAPTSDTVIMAALRIVAREAERDQGAALLAEVEQIEGGAFVDTARRRAGK